MITKNMFAIVVSGDGVIKPTWEIRSVGPVTGPTEDDVIAETFSLAAKPLKYYAENGEPEEIEVLLAFGEQEFGDLYADMSAVLLANLREANP